MSTAEFLCKDCTHFHDAFGPYPTACYSPLNEPNVVYGGPLPTKPRDTHGTSTCQFQRKPEPKRPWWRFW